MPATIRQSPLRLLFEVRRGQTLGISRGSALRGVQFRASSFPRGNHRATALKRPLRTHGEWCEVVTGRGQSGLLRLPVQVRLLTGV